MDYSRYTRDGGSQILASNLPKSKFYSQVKGVINRYMPCRIEGDFCYLDTSHFDSFFCKKCICCFIESHKNKYKIAFYYGFRLSVAGYIMIVLVLLLYGLISALFLGVILACLIGCVIGWLVLSPARNALKESKDICQTLLREIEQYNELQKP